MTRYDSWVMDLADSLTSALRDLALPHLGTAAARGLAGKAAGGDTTFTIDEKAENLVVQYLEAEKAPVAVYSEDKGLMKWGRRPEYVLVVDPIDGTRPAMAGFEAACVSVAVARWVEVPVMSDVVYGVVREIKEGGVFRAARGMGCEAVDAAGQPRPIALSMNEDVSRLFWTIGFRGRPAAELVVVLGRLIDFSSVDGAVFDIGSASYSMTRIVTGQLDAYIDIGPYMIEVAPWVEGKFREVGKGFLLNNAPYDVAASALILEEAGGVVTDVAGETLADRPLLGSDARHQMAVVASSNPRLHRLILEEVRRGMDRLREARPR